MEIKKLDIKNAVSVQHEDYFYVVHYDTIILKVKIEYSGIKEIIKLLPVSDSSNRAIINGIDKFVFRNTV